MRIALTTRVFGASGYVETRDGISRDWTVRLDAWRMIPFLVPNGLTHPLRYLEGLSPDLIVLTGGDDPGSPAERAATERAALAYADSTNTPLLGVCRGMQVINLAFGGRLKPVADHVGGCHPIDVDRPWAALYGERTAVNSFHEQGIDADGLAPGFSVAARHPKGSVEAFVHASRPIAGVMWHPEREGAPSADRTLVETLIRRGAFWK